MAVGASLPAGSAAAGTRCAAPPAAAALAAVASDEKGEVLKAQAVDYMKDKWGLSILEQAAENAGLIQSGAVLFCSASEQSEFCCLT